MRTLYINDETYVTNAPRDFEAKDTDSFIEAGHWIYPEDDYEPHIFALASHLDCDPSDLEEARHECYGLKVVELGSQEYAIGTDDEADEAWDQSLDSYLDDCGVLDSIPENLQPYFDREAWKRDARHDGRGHSLASYDGCEEEADGPDGVTYYIFRLN